MTKCKLLVTPIVPKHKLETKVKGDPIDKIRYQRLVFFFFFLLIGNHARIY